MGERCPVPTVEDGGVASERRARHARGHAPDEVIAISVVEKNRLAIDAARHDVVQDARCI